MNTMRNSVVEKVVDIGQRALVSDRDYRGFILASSFLHIFPFPLKTAKLINDFFNSGRAREPGLSSPILNQFAQMGKAQRKDRKIREI